MHTTHTYSAPESAFLVNSFILEGDDCVVVVDAQFLMSTAYELRAKVDSLAKPLAALIVTHPHPDHYNGAAILLEGQGDIPVISTIKTNDGIRETAEGKRAFWTSHYPGDYPQSFIYPNRIAQSGELLRFGSIELVFHDLGPGEASDIVVIASPSTGELFASDLLYSACHPWMAEDRSNEWIQQLDEVERRFNNYTIIHAGHGPTGDGRLLTKQRAYIATFTEIVKNHSVGKPLSDMEKSAIVAATATVFTGYPLASLISLNADSIVRELNAKSARS